MERNGLKHGQFGEKMVDSEIRQILWNSIGTLLCVLFKTGRLDIWRSDNWHYNRQISAQFDPETSYIWFDQPNTNDIWIISGDRLYKKSIFSIISKAESSVLVQDCKELGLTKYKEASYPPPMFGYTIANPNASMACPISDSEFLRFEPNSVVKHRSTIIDGEIEAKTVHSEAEIGVNLTDVAAIEDVYVAVSDGEESSVVRIIRQRSGDNNMTVKFNTEFEFDSIFISNLTLVDTNTFYCLANKETEYYVMKANIENELEFEIVDSFGRPIKYLSVCLDKPGSPTHQISCSNLIHFSLSNWP